MFMKIGDITGKFGVSHRSLRYWEEIGIIQSSRSENDYRYYDEKNQQKIKQILVLRKLRLSLKQIIMVLESDDAAEIIDTLQQNLNEVDVEITALSTIRSILDSFITKLNENMMIDLKMNLLDDNTILEIADSLTLTRPALKDEKTMAELNKAAEQLNKLTDKNVRIVYLPPFTVASAYCISDNPHQDSFAILKNFIKDADLFKIKPDMRVFGMGNTVDGHWVYEVWATIPDGFNVPAPLTKKTMGGGLYAAYTSANFDERLLLKNWIDESARYEFDYRENPGYSLEEAVNPFNIYGLKDPSMSGVGELVFLWSIKERKQE